MPESTPRTLILDAAFPVRPSDIDTGAHFWSAFGNRETEVSANYIVEFCAQRDDTWLSFSREDIDAFYNQQGHTGFWFNGLLPVGYIVPDTTGRFYLTAEFVRACFLASPAARGRSYARELFGKEWTDLDPRARLRAWEDLALRPGLATRIAGEAHGVGKAGGE